MTHPHFCLWGPECYNPAKVRSDWAAAISVASLKSFLRAPLYSFYNVAPNRTDIQWATASKWQLHLKLSLIVDVGAEIFGTSCLFVDWESVHSSSSILCGPPFKEYSPWNTHYLKTERERDREISWFTITYTSIYPLAFSHSIDFSF